MKTAIKTALTSPLIIAAGNVLSGTWAASNAGGVLSTLSVRNPDGDALEACETCGRSLTWTKLAHGTVTTQGHPRTIAEAKRVIMERHPTYDVAVADSHLTYTRHLDTHSRTGKPVSESQGILRLEPGTWTVAVSDDGQTVTLTKAD